MNRLVGLIDEFTAADDGTQAIEYALIVAVVALTLLLGLRDILGSDFTGFIARLNGCLSNSTCN